mmetsp:Transcript_4042/g.4334  ORF Transcript_4042/g.4334 Transcript_4042/m.4334 type:complete len:111 (+) Transcript_4042:100-432(+)
MKSEINVGDSVKYIIRRKGAPFEYGTVHKVTQISEKSFWFEGHPKKAIRRGSVEKVSVQKRRKDAEAAANAAPPRADRRRESDGSTSTTSSTGSLGLSRLSVTGTHNIGG